jgi:hypothetical protein
VVVLAGHPTACLGPPCKVLNQSIVGLSPLSEILTPLAMRSLTMEVDEYYARIIVWYNIVCTRWLIWKRINPLELVLKY